MAGKDAFGTSISKGDGEAIEVFSAVGNVTSISLPSLERETYDVTAHDSTDGWREFIGGLKDGGEVSFDVNYDPNEHVPLTMADTAETDPSNWEVAFPSGALWAFAAILTSSEADAPHDGQLEGSITLKISGAPVFTAAV